MFCHSFGSCRLVTRSEISSVGDELWTFAADEVLWFELISRDVSPWTGSTGFCSWSLRPAMPFKVQALLVVKRLTLRCRDGSDVRNWISFSKSIVYRNPAMLITHSFFTGSWCASSISFDVLSSYCHQPFRPLKQECRRLN